MKKQSGQILVLVLLIVVVSLAVGLAVASRNLTNLRTSTQAEQSQRAFTAAEGGVENTLSNLNNVAKAIGSGNAGDAGAGCANATVTPGVSASCSLPSTVTASGINTGSSNVVVKANQSYEKTVQPGDVAQINLLNFAGQVDVEWAKNGEPDKVSLEFTFICNTSNGANTCGYASSTTPIPPGATYGQHRVAYTSSGSISGQSGFTTCTSSPGFACKNSFTIPTSANVVILRMKPFWDRVTIKVTPQTNSAQFPVQTYEITSTATTDSGLSRKVQVTRDALPQLPAVFDYVLYSGQDIIK